MTDELWAAYFAALYPVWGIVALLVGCSYGAAARASWLKTGGTWFSAPREWGGALAYVVRGCCRDVWHVVTLRGLSPEPVASSRYTAGHLLRLFVAMSFMQSAFFGIALHSVDRSDWSTWLRVCTAVSVNFAIVGGMGHLFLAWQRKQRLWRWSIAIVACAVPIGTILQILLPL